MTTDTTALQERIARAIRLADTGDTLPDGFAARMWDEGVTNRDKEMRLAAAVLPIIARVRRDAAREALDGLAIDLAVTSGYTEAEEVRDYRDAHYPETGDRA